MICMFMEITILAFILLKRITWYLRWSTKLWISSDLHEDFWYHDIERCKVIIFELLYRPLPFPISFLKLFPFSFWGPISGRPWIGHNLQCLFLIDVFLYFIHLALQGARFLLSQILHQRLLGWNALIEGSINHVLGRIFNRQLLQIEPGHKLLKSFVAALVRS